MPGQDRQLIAVGDRVAVRNHGHGALSHDEDAAVTVLCVDVIGVTESVVPLQVVIELEIGCDYIPAVDPVLELSNLVSDISAHIGGVQVHRRRMFRVVHMVVPCLNGLFCPVVDEIGIIPINIDRDGLDRDASRHEVGDSDVPGYFVGKRERHCHLHTVVADVGGTSRVAPSESVQSRIFHALQVKIRILHLAVVGGL